MFINGDLSKSWLADIFVFGAQRVKGEGGLTVNIVFNVWQSFYNYHS